MGEIRGVGLIAAVELVAGKETKAPFETVGRLGRYLSARAQDLGMISRAMGDAVAFCPPLISKEEDIQAILKCFEESLETTWQWFQAGQA